MDETKSQKGHIYKPVSPQVSFPEVEAEILSFWKENVIFQKSVELRRGAEEFVFYEGPPTANGKPGSHHVLSRIFKDIFPRFKTMKGFHVPRKAGWDTHGLPVELEVERQLGISGKRDIEKIGIAKFNRLCRESIYRYLEDWERLTERVGFWIDTQDAYYTLDNGYIDSVWWALKQIWETRDLNGKRLLYYDYKVVPYCARCGTTLSSHEVDQGYKTVEDPSVYVRFPLVDDPDLSLLVWTTTPWTLISNVAAAISPDIAYAEIEHEGQRLIMAQDLVPKLFKDEARIVRGIPAAALAGRAYSPPYDFVRPDKKAYFIVEADFVSAEEGTGIVHIAPAFGADDMMVARRRDLPLINPVNEEGRFDERVKPWAGQFVRDANEEIVLELEQRNLLVAHVPYEHSYPHCWRCDTALIYYAKASWYIKTTEIRQELLAANEEVTWHPDHIKHGRFGNWLENNIDWALSRERYWGTPLPVWRCRDGHEHCVGGIDELRKLSTEPLADDLDLHRPFIDAVKLECPQCGAEMTREPEVIDAWFDSGSMPFAQWHYPSLPDSKTLLESFYPANFICEAIDQTRGWFYSLMAVSTLLNHAASAKGTDKENLELFLKAGSSYQNVVCLGHILDRDGQKMSKSRGNVVEPWQVLDRQGADAFRWYLFTVSSPWYPRRFFPEAIDEVVRKFLLTLWNTYSFFTVYANIDGFNPLSHDIPVDERPLMDRWIIGSLQVLVNRVTGYLERYDATTSGREIQVFVDDLSNWYVRRSRRRFWKSEEDRDKISAYLTLHECLVTVAKLLAPFTPFISEEIYRNLVCSVDAAAPMSVHLCDFPESDVIFSELSERMQLVRRIVNLGRATRNKAAVKTRQPLAEAVAVASDEEQVALAGLEHLILEELNVKRLGFVSTVDQLYDVKLKPNLQKLGPRFGSRRPQADAAIAALDPAEVRALIENGGIGIMVDGREEQLQKDDILVEKVNREGYAVEEGGGYAVAIKTGLTEPLRREGLARELVHKVQNLRKEAGFEIEDTITAWVSGSGELEDVIREHAEFFQAETLCRELNFAAAPAGGKIYTATVTIDSEALSVSILRSNS
ncbi:MAG: isoleucine--tRNA ligase [Actinobacteria bacterium]|nr:isoleucine--tRNA ligase [Actinomycetota bacterium]